MEIKAKHGVSNDVLFVTKMISRKKERKKQKTIKQVIKSFQIEAHMSQYLKFKTAL
jgi:hypothetical protein